jgi:hypothetical protein
MNLKHDLKTLLWISSMIMLEREDLDNLFRMD